jgi:membrane-associated phospholipid phosphatase
MDYWVPHYFETSLFFKFIKSSELIIFIIHLFNCLTNDSIQESNKSFFILLMTIVSCNINFVLKNFIARPLFSCLGDNILFLGQGTRPEGAVNCSYFDTCPNKIPSSFGFPSGHSQFAGAYSGFIISNIFSKLNRENSSESYNIVSIFESFKCLSLNSKLSVILHFAYILIMMYSRVYIAGCHTVLQTVYGSLIGFFIGTVSNKIYVKYRKFIENTFYIDKFVSKIILLLITVCLSLLG